METITLYDDKDEVVFSNCCADNDVIKTVIEMIRRGSEYRGELYTPKDNSRVCSFNNPNGEICVAVKTDLVCAFAKFSSDRKLLSYEVIPAVSPYINVGE